MSDFPYKFIRKMFESIQSEIQQQLENNIIFILFWILHSQLYSSFTKSGDQRLSRLFIVVLDCRIKMSDQWYEARWNPRFDAVNAHTMFRFCTITYSQKAVESDLVSLNIQIPYFRGWVHFWENLTQKEQESQKQAEWRHTYKI